jgi:hypothetical protein
MLPKAATALEGMLPNPISKPPIVAMMLCRSAEFLSRKVIRRKIEKLDQLATNEISPADWCVALSPGG